MTNVYLEKIAEQYKDPTLEGYRQAGKGILGGIAGSAGIAAVLGSRGKKLITPSIEGAVLGGGVGYAMGDFSARAKNEKFFNKKASEQESSKLKNTAAVLGAAAAGVYGKNVYDRSRPISDLYTNAPTGDTKHIRSGTPTANTVVNTVKKDVVSNIVEPAKKLANKAAVDYKVVAKKLAASSLARKITPLV